MIRLLCVGDPHLADNPPASRIDDYKESIFLKFDQIYLLAKELKVNAVLFPGDLFHIKSSIRNSYEMIIQVEAYLEQLSKITSVVMIAGNHDMVYGNPKTLMRQPCGVILTLPYVANGTAIQDGTCGCVVQGHNYSATQDLSMFSRLSFSGEIDYKVGLFHAYIMPSDMIPDEPVFKFSELKDSIYDIFVTGHLHTPTFVTKKFGKIFINPGALSRGSIAQDDIDRKVTVVLIEIDKKGDYKNIDHDVKVKPIFLKIKPASEVFDLTKRKVIKESGKKVEEFVDAITKELATLEETSPAKILDEMDIDSKVRKVARQYLDGGGLNIEELL